MSINRTVEDRKAGLRPHFIGDDETVEAYEERMAPITGAQQAEQEEFEAWKAARAEVATEVAVHPSLADALAAIAGTAVPDPGVGSALPPPPVTPNA